MFCFVKHNLFLPFSLQDITILNRFNDNSDKENFCVIVIFWIANTPRSLNLLYEYDSAGCEPALSD